MNVPACVWNPQDTESLRQIQRWPRSAQWSQRAESPSSRGRDAADLVDSLRMNLRQAKDAITVRDEETRRLRAAVTHLEGTLSLRERELRDTVLCLRGASPARPHQEWLQEGTSSSRLRLQVHRLQRAGAAKQDHIDHLNRQASLGFLREAREQADEYRTEVKRLARTLAAATGGIGGPERPSSGFATPKPFASMTTGAGDAAVVVDRPEEGDRDNQAPTRAATTDASGWYPRTTPPASQVPEPLATGGGGRRVVEALQSSSNENNAWSLARRKGGEGDQPKQPSLAWEATIGAAIRESWGTSGKVQRRDMPRDTQFIPRSTNVVDDLRVGLAAFSPPVAATHGGSPRRRKGTSSPRTVRQGSPREGRSPDLWSAYSERKRLSCMAASARFRASTRQSAAERNEVLALTEEVRRLQAARTERARRARLARQQIARYREERIHELESRLARRCGRKSKDAGDTTEPVSPEKKSHDQTNDTGGGSDECDDRGEDGGAPVDAGVNSDSKLQKLSRQRKEIEAAIAAALEDKYGQEKSPRSDRRNADPERRPHSASRRRTGTREERHHGRPQRRRQRQSSDSDGFSQEENSFTHGDQQLETPTRPIGKPPRAPARSGDRSRQSSGARRTSSVGEVGDAPNGSGGDSSNTESFAWGSGHCSDVDDVQTEVSGRANDDGIDDSWRENRLSDVEGSVWEEPFSFRGWDDGDEERGFPRGGGPPVLMEREEVDVQDAPNRDNSHRRHRHRVTGTHGYKQTGAEDWREERVPAPATRTTAPEGKEDLCSGGARVSTGRTRPLVAKNGDHVRPSRAGENLALSTNEVAVGSNNSRRQHRRKQLERSREQDDEDLWERAEEDTNAPENLFEAPAALRDDGGKRNEGSGVREQRNVAAGDLDDEGSCNSRWSLSAEDEANERTGAENDTHVQRMYSDDGARGEDGFRGQTTSADAKAQGDVPEANTASVSETAEHAIDNVAGMVPEYLEDFFDGAEKEGQGNDVPFAVSTPSDEEAEAFAATKELSTDRNGPVAQPPAADGHRRDQDQFRADANTESNEWLINEPPGRPRRPLPVPGENYKPDQTLLQPVFPTALRYDPEYAAEDGPLGAAGAVHHSSTAEPVVIKVDDGSGKNKLAPENSKEQSTDLVGHDTRNTGQTKGESKPGKEVTSDGVAASMKIDSTVLFASLSSSTAGASISSKSMVRVEGKGLNPIRKLAGARQSEVSSSTFALSADDDDDDDDDDDGTGKVPASEEGNKVTLRSAASLDAKRPSKGEHGSVVNDNGAATHSTPGSASESRVPSSTEHDNGVYSAGNSRLSTTSPSSGGTGNPDGVPVEGMDLGSTPSPHATMPSPQPELILPSTDNQPEASLENKERSSQRDPRIVDDNGERARSTEPAPRASAEPTGYPRSIPLPLGETAAVPATRLEGDFAVNSAQADYSTRSGRTKDEGDAAGPSAEGAILERRSRNISHYQAEDESLGEEGGFAGDLANSDCEGIVGTLEEGSLVGRDSSHSGSVLDVGGGGVDDVDGDDDGYF